MTESSLQNVLPREDRNRGALLLLLHAFDMPFLLPWYELQQAFCERLAATVDWTQPASLGAGVEAFLQWRAEAMAEATSSRNQLAALASAYFLHLFGSDVSLDDVVARLVQTKVRTRRARLLAVLSLLVCSPRQHHVLSSFHRYRCPTQSVFKGVMPGRQTAIIYGLQVRAFRARGCSDPSQRDRVSPLPDTWPSFVQTAASQLDAPASTTLKVAMTLYDEDVVEEDAWFEWQGGSDADFPGKVRVCSRLHIFFFFGFFFLSLSTSLSLPMKINSLAIDTPYTFTIHPFLLFDPGRPRGCAVQVAGVASEC